MEKQDFIDFATRILKLEEDKKEIGVEIKESYDAFAENNGLETDSIKDGVSAYKKFLKDKERFYTVDQEVSNIINTVMFSEFTQEG